MLRRFILVLFTCLMITTYISALETPEIKAKGAILYEATNGEVVFEQNADVKVFPASTTKLMTAIIALEYGNYDDTVTVRQSAIDGLSAMNSSTYLLDGEEISFKTLFEYMLIGSGNDASNALAEHVSGSQQDFVALMNLKAKELGCTGTQFTNTHGLHDENHYTTARDTLKIAMHAMEFDLIREAVQTEQITLPITNRHTKTTTISTTNYLISKKRSADYFYKDAIGIKTGTTTPAGRCLVSSAQKDNLLYYCVVMGAEVDEATGALGNFTETIKLYNWAESSFSIQTMVKSTDPVTEVDIRLGKDRDNVMLTPSGTITALLPSDFDPTQVEVSFETLEDVVAPVAKGDVLGTATYSYNGRVYGTLDLISANDAERSQTLYVIDRITGFLGSTTFKIIVGVLLGLILLFTAYVIFVNRARKRKRRRRGGGGGSGSGRYRM